MDNALRRPFSSGHNYCGHYDNIQRILQVVKSHNLNDARSHLTASDKCAIIMPSIPLEPERLMSYLPNAHNPKCKRARRKPDPQSG